ncbi:MAG TPA: hypothetical protein PLB00_08730 [Pseudomonadota bacterium]|jgi:hypothetical protein|nr:hypothetical protein [Pseudomonadota bacterium]
MTIVVKRVFPALWVGFAIWILVLGGLDATHPSDIVRHMFPLGFALVGLAYFLVTSSSLMDEVIDCGSHLIVRNNRNEVRILIASIMNVNQGSARHHSRITLRLDRSCQFGNEIAFIPTGRFTFNLLENEVAEELIARVDRARRIGKRYPRQ